MNMVKVFVAVALIAVTSTAYAAPGATQLLCKDKELVGVVVGPSQFPRVLRFLVDFCTDKEDNVPKDFEVLRKKDIDKLLEDAKKEQQEKAKKDAI